MPPARRSTRTASSNTARASAQPYARANRQNSPGAARPSASIARQANGKTSLRLTVKAPPSKLRQATSGSQIDDATIPPNPYAENFSESDATPQPSTRIARSTRNPRTVVEPESEEDNKDEGADEALEEEEEKEEEEEEGDDDRELLDNEDSEEVAEDEDEDMDELQEEHPPAPIIKVRSNDITKPDVMVTAPEEGPLQSVEDKEMEDDDEEEELSELDSNDNDEDDEEEDSDDDSDKSSRGATPDLSKLTRRQRGAYEEAETGNLMALSNEAQKKKHLTAEEHAMRRAEMARRRKNLSEKRNEEEKMDTINKLLKKPAPKRRTRAEIIAAQQMDSMATPGAEEGEEERPDPLFVRWVQSREGSRLGVPIEWMEGPIGDVFSGGGPAGGGGGPSSMMVEEVA